MRHPSRAAAGNRAACARWSGRLLLGGPGGRPRARVGVGGAVGSVGAVVAMW